MFAPMKHRWNCDYCEWHLLAPTERILCIEIYKHLEVKHVDQEDMKERLERLHSSIQRLSNEAKQ